MLKNNFESGAFLHMNPDKLPPQQQLGMNLSEISDRYEGYEG